MRITGCGRRGGAVSPDPLFQAPASAAVGRALAAPVERLRPDAGEDPANEVSTLGLFHDDLVADLAGVHVDEMAVGGAVEGEAVPAGRPAAATDPIPFSLRAGDIRRRCCNRLKYLHWLMAPSTR